MIQRIYILGLLLFSILFVGCSDFDDDETVSQTELRISNVEQNGKMGFGCSSFSFDIECNDQAWSVEGPDWVSIKPKSGSGNAKIMVALKDSTSKESISDVISIKCDGRTPEIHIENIPYVFNVELDGDPVFTKNGGEKTIIIICNDSLDWKCKIEPEGSWLTISENSSSTGIGKDKIIVSSRKNDGRELQTASINVYPKNREDLKKTITLTQSPTLGIYPPKNGLSFDGSYIEESISLNPNTDDWDVYSINRDWIEARRGEVKNKQGVTDKLIVVCKENPGEERTGDIIINTSDKYDTIHIIQEKLYYIKPGSPTIPLSPKKTIGDTKIDSNVTWDIYNVENGGFINIFVYDEDGKPIDYNKRRITGNATFSVELNEENRPETPSKAIVHLKSSGDDVLRNKETEVEINWIPGNF